nr:OmpH family outer membrane protein [Bacteroidales bacterium]
MKKFIVITILVLAATLSGAAQKFAFVDSEYIRNNIPAFTAAQQQLDKLSQDWEKEVADGYAAVEQMYKDYQAEV